MRSSAFALSLLLLALCLPATNAFSALAFRLPISVTSQPPGSTISTTFQPAGRAPQRRPSSPTFLEVPEMPRRSMRLAEKQGTGPEVSRKDGTKEQKALSPLRRAIKRLEEAVNERMEDFVRICPRPIMAVLARLLFWPTLWWNFWMRKEKSGSGEKRNWYDRVEDQIILGALPYAKLVPKLKEEGVTHVLNMVAEWGGPEKEYEKYGIIQKRIPVIDFSPPSVADIQEGAEFVSQVVNEGGTVYVHCKAGRGRSASVCMGYLMKEKGMTPLAAQQLLTSKRPHVLHVLHQRPVILDLATKLGQRL